MDSTINSISTVLPQLLKLFNNAVESFERLTEAVTTSKDNVMLNIISNDDSLKQISVPSFGSIKNRLSIIEKNWESVAGSESTTSIRMPDGSFRKILVNEIKGEPTAVTGLSSISEFNTKSNYFLETLMDPMMYVTVDVTGKVPIDIENVQIAKFILDLDTTSKLDWFDSTYKGISDVSYISFIREIIDRKIGYILDERILDVPPRQLRYTGKFSVLRISDTTVTEVINGTSIVKNRKKYKLNKLTYTDTKSNFEDTISLKVNDYIVVESTPRDTKYKIIEIDSTTNSVVLEVTEGFRSVKIGADVISFYSDKDNTVNLEIPIGFNERCVFFIKPIDPDSKLPSKSWSPGIGMFTNELKIKTTNGDTQTLDLYYKSEIIDFGNYVISIAKERIPPATLGLIPDAPILNVTDFKVVQINDHITDTTTLQDIENLQSEKESLDAEIKELDKTIKIKREKIATEVKDDVYTSQSDQNELQKLIDDRNNKSQLYSDIVKDIESKSKATNLTDAKPKFRTRGFFPFPALKYSNETGYQNIIQFITYYRYLSIDGSANNVKQFEFLDGSNTKSGAFTNWVPLRSEIRERIYNQDTGLYEWKENNVQDADQYNINSIDLPISKGEIIEIKVKSVSEAGWPSNPLMSDFSNTIQIEFPSNLDQGSISENILAQNQNDLLKVKLQDELRNIGIYQHVQSSFISQGKYFPHDATAIASGFLSPEQAPISLFDKLVEMSTQLQLFNEILRKAKGTLLAKVVDEEGNQIIIKKNQITKLFAGYYFDAVKNLEIKKGVIVSKTYTLTFENTAATTLELISRVAGTYTKQVKASEPSTVTYATGILPASYTYYNNNDTTIDGNPSYSTNDSDYNTLRRYDLAPIVLSNPTLSDAAISVKFPYQSSQVKSQFIYVRYKDIASEENFFSYDRPDANGEKIINNNKLLSTINTVDDAEHFYNRLVAGTAGGADDFIWSGSFNMNTTYGTSINTLSYYGAADTCIDVHMNHPYISNAAAFKAAYERITGLTLTITPSGTYDAVANAKQIFRHSKFAPLVATSTLGKKQCIYLFDKSATAPTGLSVRGVTPSSIVFDRTVKTSFEENDQYLLGKYSCGCYLIMASDSHETICVDGKSSTSKVNLEYGSQHSIRIPLIFQYRMTDYWGQGNDGMGNIAGDISGATTNITYSKKIGIDLYDIDKEVYSYDIEISSKYKSDNLKLEQLPVRSLQVAIDDVTKTIASMSPNIVEAKVNSSKQVSVSSGTSRISSEF